ncbi:MAG TPA: FHA domain-containing protein [Thermoguttaceae bacterium]|nr:FHA domain-containing protein [Thermoguttaceae bacterium]
MRVKLVSQSPWTPKRRIVVKRFPAMIGRDPDAEVQVDDRWASRRHCEIDQVDGTLVVRDVGSRHGTFVNGESVRSARLLPGDRLTVGATSFEVVYRRTAGRPAEQPHAASSC